MNNRRKLFMALGAGALAAPFASFAQQPGKVWRIGFLSSESPSSYRTRVEPLRAGLRERGYEEGRNLAIEFRWAEGKTELLPALAADLVRLKVDVIVTHGVLPVRAAQTATATIPIVFASTGDAVALGFAANLARPGGNLTGSVFFNLELNAKRVELIKEVLPGIAQLAVLVNPDSPNRRLLIQAMDDAVRSVKVNLQMHPVRKPGEFEGAFAAMAKQRAGAVVVNDDPMFISHATALAALAAKRRMPAIGFTELAEAGGLMSYGVNFPAMWRRAGIFVDKILKGARPGDIPIEQATTFELVINLKTAKALGIKIPQSILVRADKVIE
jgi:putative ABC transport system substrate-binding protein